MTVSSRESRGSRATVASIAGCRWSSPECRCAGWKRIDGASEPLENRADAREGDLPSEKSTNCEGYRVESDRVTVHCIGLQTQVIKSQYTLH